jgi:hypothetical protein
MKHNFFFKAMTLYLLATMLLVSVCSNSFVSASDDFAPNWLKKGVYAEYLFPSTSGIHLTPEGEVVEKENPGAVFRWECVDINSTFAELKITFYYNETEESRPPNNIPAKWNTDWNNAVLVTCKSVSRRNCSIVECTTGHDNI